MMLIELQTICSQVIFTLFEYLQFIFILSYVVVSAIPPMVQDAKQVAVNPADANAVSHWRESNKGVSLIQHIPIVLLQIN